MNNQPIILATIPSDQDDQRLQVIMDQEASGTKLRVEQQSFGNGIGWYTQSSVEIAPDQLPVLRQAFGMTGQSTPIRPKVDVSSARLRVV